MGALVVYDQIRFPLVILSAKKLAFVVRSEPMYTIFLDDRVGVEIITQVAPIDFVHITAPVNPSIALTSQLSSPKKTIFFELMVGDELIESLVV